MPGTISQKKSTTLPSFFLPPDRDNGERQRQGYARFETGRKAPRRGEGRSTVVLGHIRYFVRHAQWLQDRFPDAALRDVEGLVKLIDFKDLEAVDWSLAPGR